MEYNKEKRLYGFRKLSFKKILKSYKSHKWIRIGYFILFSVIISSCTEDENLSQEQVNRTIIVYMAADNDLSFDALADIEEMKQSFSATGVNLIVFADIQGEALVLANTILEKKVKIPSATVSMIRNEMQQMTKNINDKHKTLEERQNKVLSEESLETVLPP
jgi:hypothetical protein